MSNVNTLINNLNDGVGNEKSAYQVENDLNMDAGRTQEATRDLIRSAIVDYHMPIGSNRYGYFLIDDVSELNSVIDALQRRINGLQNRIDGIRNGWKKRQASRNNGQNWPK